nr:hypothetical protein [Tanacetum cinerariifolium]
KALVVVLTIPSFWTEPIDMVLELRGRLLESNRSGIPLVELNKIGAPQGEELGLMNPLSESSCSCSDNSFILDGANRYGARATGAAPRIKSIWNSTGRAGGRLDKSSGNTSGKS